MGPKFNKSREKYEKILSFPSSNQVFNGETLLIVGENSTYVSADSISLMRKNFQI